MTVENNNCKDRLLIILRNSLEQGTFIKLVLGKYRGIESGLRKITVRCVIVGGCKQMSFVRHYQTKNITKNYLPADGIEYICSLVGTTFRSACLFTGKDDIQIEFNKKGKCRLTSCNPTHGGPVSLEHNRNKKRPIDQRGPFLNALGITNQNCQVIPAMSQKWRQINRFIEIFRGAFLSSDLATRNRIDVVDYGSGKGYLTFAIYDFLRHTIGVEAHVTGVELREDLVHFCNDAAERLKFDGLRFRRDDIRSYTPEAVDVLIALHACDTATDMAIHMGIRAGAAIIMCVPCCHKQIRPQLKVPDVIKPLFRFGVHAAQEAEIVTDSIRALLLEAWGYKPQVFEFTPVEDTNKNKMILGIKHSRVAEREEVLSRIKAIKDFYGIQKHILESLLDTNTDKGIL